MSMYTRKQVLDGTGHLGRALLFTGGRNSSYFSTLYHFLRILIARRIRDPRFTSSLTQEDVSV